MKGWTILLGTALVGCNLLPQSCVACDRAFYSRILVRVNAEKPKNLSAGMTRRQTRAWKIMLDICHPQRKYLELEYDLQDRTAVIKTNRTTRRLQDRVMILIGGVAEDSPNSPRFACSSASKPKEGFRANQARAKGQGCAFAYFAALLCLCALAFHARPDVGDHFRCLFSATSA